MSGGSMDYLSAKVQEAQFLESTPERRAFRKHLQLVAKAMHIIEWNDSSDGADGEAEAIRACLAEGAVLDEAVAEARRVLKELTEELARATSNSLTGDT